MPLLLEKFIRTLNIARTMPFYAVARGHQIGVFDTWSKCEKQVKGFKGARYKKFPTLTEAQNFIKNESSTAGSGGNMDKNSDRNKGNEFWPESDGDSFLENGPSDQDLLAVVSMAESLIPKASSSITNLGKRKLEEPTTSEAKLPRLSSIVYKPVGTKQIGKYEFEIDSEDFVIVYTDGSCINNGKRDACAGYGVYFGENHPLNASEPVKKRVTNNAGEIQAAIHAIKEAKRVGVPKLCISTDSQFLINSISFWVTAWKQKNWRLANGDPVKNKDDFKELDGLLHDDRIHVKWNYVKAHHGILGNEMADKLAREGSEMYRLMHSKGKSSFKK